MNTPLPKTPEEKMRAALSLVLLFHSGRSWDSTARKEWETGLEAVLGPVPVAPDTHEATTKVLCNAVRAALASDT